MRTVVNSDGYISERQYQYYLDHIGSKQAMEPQLIINGRGPVSGFNWVQFNSAKTKFNIGSFSSSSDDTDRFNEYIQLRGSLLLNKMSVLDENEANIDKLGNIPSAAILPSGRLQVFDDLILPEAGVDINVTQENLLILVGQEKYSQQSNQGECPIALFKVIFSGSDIYSIYTISDIDVLMDSLITNNKLEKVYSDTDFNVPTTLTEFAWDPKIHIVLGLYTTPGDHVNPQIGEGTLVPWVPYGYTFPILPLFTTTDKANCDKVPEIESDVDTLDDIVDEHTQELQDVIHKDDYKNIEKLDFVSKTDIGNPSMTDQAYVDAVAQLSSNKPKTLFIISDVNLTPAPPTPPSYTVPYATFSGVKFVKCFLSTDGVTGNDTCKIAGPNETVTLHQYGYLGGGYYGSGSSSTFSGGRVLIGVRQSMNVKFKDWTVGSSSSVLNQKIKDIPDSNTGDFDIISLSDRNILIQMMVDGKSKFVPAGTQGFTKQGVLVGEGNLNDVTASTLFNTTVNAIFLAIPDYYFQIDQKNGESALAYVTNTSSFNTPSIADAQVIYIFLWTSNEFTVNRSLDNNSAATAVCKKYLAQGHYKTGGTYHSGFSSTLQGWADASALSNVGYYVARFQGWSNGGFLPVLLKYTGSL